MGGEVKCERKLNIGKFMAAGGENFGNLFRSK
jgi:hypothetical protein